MQNIFRQNLLNRRKALGLTQEQLAAKLNVSFQAVSKWERGETLPDIKLLPALASQLGTSADSLLGYEGATPATIYEERYRTQELYWGGEPNEMCYDILRLLPPQKRRSIIETYQSKMPRGSLCALNVFVDKPFIKMPPDEEIDGAYWQSGELFTLFSDWKFHRCKQVIFDCNSGGVPHQHCMDILIAQKM